MWPKIQRALAKDPILYISGVLALISMVFAWPHPLTPADIDLRTLGLLFALMGVVAGLTRQGLMDRLAAACARLGSNTRRLCLIMTLMSFFASMLMTNDVALVTFVPLTLAVLAHAPASTVIWTIVLQTIAANLGSMATPFGNPQNLYLYACYNLSLGEFFGAVLPLAALSLGVVCALCWPVRPQSVSAPAVSTAKATPWKIGLLAALFLLCVASVLRFVPWEAAVIAVILGLALVDWKTLRKIDYGLLITFCFFFIFVGNLSRIPQVNAWISQILSGRELLVSALASQAISNVPAALMLSRFTENGIALVRGTNIGGLGTLIASMASLISFKLYLKHPGAQVKRYFLVFTAVNVALLAAFLLIAPVL